MNKFKIQYLLIVILPVLTGWIGAMLSGMQSGPGGLSLMHISLGVALLTGLIALFIRYLGGQWHFLIAVVLSLIYAAVSLKLMNAPISIMSLFLVNLANALLTIVLVKSVFYVKTLFRFRTIFFGLLGGLVFGNYLSILYRTLTVDLPSGFWSANFMYGLILYVFIGFGMSMADLIILRLDVAQLSSKGKPEDDS